TDSLTQPTQESFNLNKVLNELAISYTHTYNLLFSEKSPIQDKMIEKGIDSIKFNRSSSNLNIESSEIFSLDSESVLRLKEALYDINKGEFISFSGVVNKESGKINLLPNIPRDKKDNIFVLNSLKHKVMGGYEPVKFPTNPQSLIRKDLIDVHKGQFNFPAYKDGVNRIPEHIKHLYSILHPNNFDEQIGIQEAKSHLGFTLNLVYNQEREKVLLLDGKSQSLNGLELSLDQEWDKQPKEGSELPPLQAAKIINACLTW
ncbi:hypothetical protein, partial [Vibrio pectenicida]|uniref:hypothetical protein n=1 Tax=Vibrio pectenicida TaxID=62763 RepID=UPI00163A2DFC